MNGMDIVRLVTFVFVIIGALNWGLVGAFNFDLVAYLFGPNAIIAKAIYVLVGLSGLVLLATKASYTKD